MINLEQLKEAFREKLERTGSFDAAFKKATWIAYKAGLGDSTQWVKDVHGNKLYPLAGAQPSPDVATMQALAAVQKPEGKK